MDIMEGFAEDFTDKVLAAVESKQSWFDSYQLQKIQDDYRLHLTCINNINDALTQRGLITPDPYRKDKKISSIVCPSDANFNENERASALGLRLSDYQAMLDFICNYMKFSVEQLNLEKIRKLLELNNTFYWTNLSPNSPKINTRSLALCLVEFRSNAQPLASSLVSDSISKTKGALEEINKTLKDLAEFQKERYKAQVRQYVLKSGKVDASKLTDPTTLFSEIKKNFSSLMPAKRPFASELIEEIVQEETSPQKEQLRAQLLQKLQIADTKSEKKKQEVDTHAMLMDAISTLATMSEQYSIIIDRLNNNSHVLEGGHNSFGAKLGRLLRKVFGIPDPEVEYNIIIEDSTTKQKKKERLNFSDFSANLAKRYKYYSAIAVKHSPGYNRINAQQSSALMDFLTKQISDNTRLLTVLTALDSYFKGAAPATERSKIKGITMELTTLKNILIKTNQQKAEYIAFTEEQEQMKKLGISDD